MIIDFTIKNFRSIKERQTISFLADGAPNHLKNNIKPYGNNIGVLRSSAIYGANASGKSNLLLAFKALRFIICGSNDLKDGDIISCYEPFLLSNKTKNESITFEIEFFFKKIRYLYSVSFKEKCILTESLDFYPTQSKANIFNRKKEHTWKDITFGTRYKGGKKRFAFFENCSYLSKAGNSADAPELIRSIFNYFRHNIFHLGAEQTVKTFDWKNNPKIVDNVGMILSKVDTGISGLEFKIDEDFDIKFQKNIPKTLREKIINEEKQKALFIHETEENSIEKFTEDIESSGTIKLFNTIPMLLEAFEVGAILLLDELDNSFHPQIAELIINLFNNPKVNKNNAQLIFSTHNINLMSPNLLRRDQVWFTEKNNGSTIFYSLDEFDKSTVKNNSPYSKWYDQGRFGAIPKIDVEKISLILEKGLS